MNAFIVYLLLSVIDFSTILEPFCLILTHKGVTDIDWSSVCASMSGIVVDNPVLSADDQITCDIQGVSTPWLLVSTPLALSVHPRAISVYPTGT